MSRYDDDDQETMEETPVRATSNLKLVVEDKEEEEKDGHGLMGCCCHKGWKKRSRSD